VAGPLTAADLAAGSGADAGRLERVLRLLTPMEILPRALPRSPPLAPAEGAQATPTAR
jgi:hypothetical protein